MEINNLQSNISMTDTEIDQDVEKAVKAHEFKELEEIKDFINTVKSICKKIKKTVQYEEIL